jgi:hypothetical protein
MIGVIDNDVIRRYEETSVQLMRTYWGCNWSKGTKNRIRRIDEMQEIRCDESSVQDDRIYWTYDSWKEDRRRLYQQELFEITRR